MSKFVKIVFLAVLLLYFYHLIAFVVQHSADQQWDFMIYYFAGKAHSLGLDPYVTSNLAQISGKAIWLPYVYPPLTLWFFRLFTLLPFETAYILWLTLKIALAFGLLYIWKKYFLAHTWSLLFCFVMVFAYDSALFWDIRSGNLSLVEQFVLWAAFVAFLKEKPLVFAGLIVVVSLFKITTLAFLLLLPVSRMRWKGWYFSGALVAFLAVMVADYLWQPEMFRAYLDRILTFEERAQDFNYSTLAFFKDAYEYALRGRLPSLAALLPTLSYGAVAGAISLLSLFALRRRRRIGLTDDGKETIFLACLTYALVFPRLKCYSLVLLLVPSFYIIRTYLARKTSAAAFLLLLIPVKSSLPEAEAIAKLFLYYPLFLASLIWIAYLQYFREPIPGSDTHREAAAIPGDDTSSA